ncbi:MAG: SxtJ family membrane protein [Candidatus Omnitrophota bacterium]|nr:SxtJ family membrane protein [Candidatus Omnitrophota bacterium]
MKNNIVRARPEEQSRELRKFGFNIGLGLNILGCIMFYRRREHFIWLAAIGSAALVSAVLYPKALKPLKKFLDKLIFIIGWLMSAISMSIVFYLIFTPIAILLRIIGKDLLNEKMDKKAASYWIKRKASIFSEKSYEQMG